METTMVKAGHIINGIVSKTERIYSAGAVEPYVLYVTSEYGLFTESENRSINWDHVNRLTNEMKTYGFLPAKHIDVIRVGENLQIVDGHHRFRGCEKLGIDIYFMFTPDLSPDRIADINSTQKPWTAQDYLKFFSEKKAIKSYIELADFKKKFNFGISVAISLALGGSGGISHTELELYQRGRFKFSASEQAYDIGKWSKDYKTYFNGYKDRQFIIALHHLYHLEGYDHQRMMQKLSFQSAKLTKQADSKSYLRLLETLYNYRAQGNSLRFI